MREVLAEGVELWLGDCREVLPLLGKVDALVTDPPYGVMESYVSYDDTIYAFKSIVVPSIVLALSIAKRGAVFCNHNLHELPKPDAIGGIHIPAAVGRHCWGFNSLSPISFYGKTPLNGSYPTVLLSSEHSEQNGHPTPKPIGWMKWLVSRASLAGETILDPFMGSGTTGVAAVKLGRRFIGIEMEPKYYEIAKRRITEALRQPDMFIEKPKPVKQEAFL